MHPPVMVPQVKADSTILTRVYGCLAQVNINLTVISYR